MEARIPTPPHGHLSRSCTEQKSGSRAQSTVEPLLGCLFREVLHHVNPPPRQSVKLTLNASCLDITEEGEQRGHSSLAGRTGPYTGRSAPCNSVLLVLHAPCFGHCQGTSHQHTTAGVTCTESSSPGLSCVVLLLWNPAQSDWPVRLLYKELSRAAVSTP